MDEFRTANLANWDERAPAHAKSPGYGVDHFLSDPGYLSEVVRFDRPLLGDIMGQKGAHLQCHIGTDTISLARLGARMSGLDFSPAALQEARKLAARTGLEVEFVEAELYEAVSALGSGRFDLVYTGVGALCWLPDIEQWAGVVSDLLVSGGRLFLREGHPMLWAIGEPRADGLLVVENAYFSRPEPIHDTVGGTYVTTDAVFEHNTCYEWSHGLGEIVTALVRHDLRISGLTEHDSIPWDALPGQMERLLGGEYRLTDRPWRLAHSFTLQAVKE
ncbi:MAG: class I SAM-dependent methyltransferase [Candidatus Dormibacteria bacterium]